MIDGVPGDRELSHLFLSTLRSYFTPGASCLVVFGPSCLAMDAVDELVQFDELVDSQSFCCSMIASRFLLQKESGRVSVGYPLKRFNPATPVA